jgi:hypothetical protein
MNGSFGSGIETFTSSVDNPDKTIRIPSWAVILVANTLHTKDFRA